MGEWILSIVKNNWENNVKSGPTILNKEGKVGNRKEKKKRKVQNWMEKESDSGKPRDQTWKDDINNVSTKVEQNRKQK
jgi:hypothetical protein